MQEIKFKDINGESKSVIADDVEQFEYVFNERSGKHCVHIEINGKHIYADCHLLDFTQAWNAAIS